MFSFWRDAPPSNSLLSVCFTTLRCKSTEEKFREGATSLILTLPDREVPLEEKRLLLRPQRVPMCRAHASNVFASCNCTFSVSRGGGIRGCGLNADGQVGLGYQSLCVPSFRRVQGLDGAAWIGGGLHMSVALVGQSVFTWGRAEYCGHGATTAHVLLPRKVALPSVRTVRCGDHHTLACAEVGTLFTWGCGFRWVGLETSLVASAVTVSSLGSRNQSRIFFSHPVMAPPFHLYCLLSLTLSSGAPSFVLLVSFTLPI